MQNEQLRQAQSELTDLYERYYELYDHAPVGYAALDRGGRVKEANLTLADLLGIERARLVGRPFVSFMPPSSADAFHICLQQAFASGLRRGVDVVLETSGRGSALPAHVRVAFGDGEAGLQECRVVVVDSSELGTAERGRRAAEAQGATLLDTVADAIVSSDSSGRIESFNRAAERLFGYEAEEVLGENVRMLMPSPHREQHDLYVHRYLTTGEARIVGKPNREVTGLKKGGTTFPLELGIGEWFEGEERKFMAVLHDLSAYKRTESELRESENRFRSIFEHSPGGVVMAAPDATLLAVNPAFARFLGYGPDELQGKRFTDITYPDDVEESRRLYEELRSGRRSVVDQEKRYLHADGTIVWGHMTSTWLRDDTGSPGYAIAMIQDITDRKRAEEENRALTAQFHQAQKMEALGTLASGVAHDFSNLLMGIGGCTNIALSTLPADSPARMYLEEIKKSAEGGAGISRRLLDFTRMRQSERVQVFELNLLIAGVRGLLTRMLSEEIELVVCLEAADSRVCADPGLMEQVLVNLAANARDAMPEGGRLTLQTTNTVLFESDGNAVPAGDYVVLTATDTGCGMDEPTRQRVFEPFFTTKEMGKGTGLGLSMIHGIVRQANGAIEVESAPKRGSTFRLSFPVSSETPTRDSAAPPQRDDNLAGTGTVLVVEDDHTVRLGVKFYLEQGGYRVLEAGSGEEAIECCVNYPKQIDLLLTDVVLPGMGGREIARKVREITPATRVVYMSAHPAEWLESQERIEPGARALEKPFGAETLLLEVKRILENRVSAPVEARPTADEFPRTAPLTVLVVEDQSAARLAISAHLSDAGWNVVEAADARTALELGRTCEDEFAALLLDYRLPDLEGDALARQLKQHHPRAALVYMSGLPDLKLDPPGILLTKPLQLDVISETLERLSRG